MIKQHMAITKISLFKKTAQSHSEVLEMSIPEPSPLHSRLKRLSEEREKLQTELVQIQSMLLSIDELIAEEILRQVTGSSSGRSFIIDGNAEGEKGV